MSETLPSVEQEEFELCQHGQSRERPCMQCLVESRESQPVWQLVDNLQAKSKYKRENPGNPETVIERDGKKFKIELLNGDKEDDVQMIQNLLVETFSEAEADPIDYLRDANRGETKYRVLTLKNEEGELVSVYAGGLLNMRDGNGSENGEAVFMAAYGVTPKQNRRNGFVKELYASAMMMAVQDANATGKKFTMVVGESTRASEPTWNSVQRRRSYVKTGDNEFSELRYIQPALKFDPDTGVPADDAGEAPEHLMIHFLDGKPDKERISMCVDAIYRWCNILPEDEFNSPQAYQAHLEYIRRIKEKFNELLQGSGELLLLSAKEREVAKNGGLKINEYAEADEGKAGPEDQ